MEPWQEIEDLYHPDSRLHERELGADRPGRSASKAGGHHTFQQRHDPKDIAVTQFVREIVTYLEGVVTNHDVAHLVLVATPATLGELRQHLSKRLHGLVSVEIAKDLTRHSLAEIRAQVVSALKHKL